MTYWINIEAFFNHYIPHSCHNNFAVGTTKKAHSIALSATEKCILATEIWPHLRNMPTAYLVVTDSSAMEYRNSVATQLQN